MPGRSIHRSLLYSCPPHNNFTTSKSLSSVVYMTKNSIYEISKALLTHLNHNMLYENTQISCNMVKSAKTPQWFSDFSMLQFAFLNDSQISALSCAWIFSSIFCSNRKISQKSPRGGFFSITAYTRFLYSNNSQIS